MRKKRIKNIHIEDILGSLHSVIILDKGNPSTEISVMTGEIPNSGWKYEN